MSNEIPNEKILELIDKVVPLLKETSIQYWLGRGVLGDFIVNRELKCKHGDVDFHIWEKDKETLKKQLTAVFEKERYCIDKNKHYKLAFYKPSDVHEYFLEFMYLFEDENPEIAYHITYDKKRKCPKRCFPKDDCENIIIGRHEIPIPSYIDEYFSGVYGKSIGEKIMRIAWNNYRGKIISYFRRGMIIIIIMAQVFGEESKYLKISSIYYQIGALLFYILLIYAIYTYAAVSILTPRNLGITILLAIIYLILFKIITRSIDKNINISGKFRRGGQGESKILSVLKTFTDDFAIFQDIKSLDKRSNIDFVVVGPTGIFAIEVKSHSGKIDFDGVELTRNGAIFPEKNILSQVLKQVYSLRDYLKEKTEKEYFVIPVIVFSNDYASMRFGLKPVHKNVRVVQKRFLKELILENNSKLSQADINKLKEIFARV